MPNSTPDRTAAAQVIAGGTLKPRQEGGMRWQLLPLIATAVGLAVRALLVEGVGRLIHLGDVRRDRPGEER
jgi:hypothetical protein